MKKVRTDEMRPEYKRKDFGIGVRGKYYRAYQEGTNLVLLNPEVAAAFPTEKSVNNALQLLTYGFKKTEPASLIKKFP